MAIVRIRDPRVNITYVYESHSFWDKERKTSRAKRRLIGKIDEKTGEIVPTSGSRRKKDQNKDGIDTENVTARAVTPKNEVVSDSNEIAQLKDMIAALQESNRVLTTKMDQAAALINSAANVLKR